MVPPVLTQVLSLVQADRAGSDAMGSGRFYHTPPGARPRLALAGPFLGAPQAVMAMEKMIALGSKRFWLLGWCGSLRQDLRIGDIVVPTRAISEEGTSRHYPVEGRDPQCSEVLIALIQGALERRGIPYRKGPVWTTDAPYRETPSKVQAYAETGVLGVEMELAAMMTVSRFRGVSLAGLLLVSDELSGLKWHPGFSSDALKKASLPAAAALLEAVAACEREEGESQHVTTPDD